MDITTSTDPETGLPFVTAVVDDKTVTATTSPDRSEVWLRDEDGESMVLTVKDAREFAAVLTAIVTAADAAPEGPAGMTPHRA